MYPDTDRPAMIASLAKCYLEGLPYGISEAIDWLSLQPENQRVKKGEGTKKSSKRTLGPEAEELRGKIDGLLGKNMRQVPLPADRWTLTTQGAGLDGIEYPQNIAKLKLVVDMLKQSATKWYSLELGLGHPQQQRKRLTAQIMDLISRLDWFNQLRLRPAVALFCNNIYSTLSGLATHQETYEVTWDDFTYEDPAKVMRLGDGTLTRQRMAREKRKDFYGFMQSLDSLIDGVMPMLNESHHLTESIANARRAMAIVRFIYLSKNISNMVVGRI